MCERLGSSASSSPSRTCSPLSEEHLEGKLSCAIGNVYVSREDSWRLFAAELGSTRAHSSCLLVSSPWLRADRDGKSSSAFFHQLPPHFRAGPLLVGCGRAYGYAAFREKRRLKEIRGRVRWEEFSLSNFMHGVCVPACTPRYQKLNAQIPSLGVLTGFSAWPLAWGNHLVDHGIPYARLV